MHLWVPLSERRGSSAQRRRLYSYVLLVPEHLLMRFLDNLRERRTLLGISLVAVTLLFYLPVVHHDFIQLWDDDAYVTDNVHVRTGIKLTNLSWAFTSFEQSNWHPLTWLSHMLDCQIFGLNPGAQHSVNVLLH